MCTASRCSVCLTSHRHSFINITRLCCRHWHIHTSHIHFAGVVVVLIVAFSLHARIFFERLDDSFSACSFFFIFLSGDELAHTNSTPEARISPQWLNELIRLWPSVPWRTTCELGSLICFHTMPGQHGQPTQTSLGQVCMRVPRALFAEWPVCFMCHCDDMVSNGHRIRVSTEN